MLGHKLCQVLSADSVTFATFRGASPDLAQFYGRTEPEVAARLIHDALLRLLPPPELTPPAAAPESSVESPGSDGASKPRS